MSTGATQLSWKKRIFLLYRGFVAFIGRREDNRTDMSDGFHIHAGGFATRNRALHCWDNLLTGFHQLAMASQPLEHAVKRDIAEVGREVFLIGEQAFLLL